MDENHQPRSTCALICNGICGLIIFPGIVTLIVWALLYHSTWAYPVSIALLVIFGLNLILMLIITALAFCTLCCLGTVFAISGQGAPICILFVVGLAYVFYTIIPFGICVYGVILSIDLMNSGGQTCPVSNAKCDMLVLIVFLSLLMSGSRQFFARTFGSRSEQELPLLRGYTNVDEVLSNGVQVKTTEVCRGGFVTTTVERTENGVTTTTTSTRPIEGLEAGPGFRNVLVAMVNPFTATRILTQSDNGLTNIRRPLQAVDI